MQDNKHELKVLMLDGATGFYRMHRYRVGDFIWGFIFPSSIMP